MKLETKELLKAVSIAASVVETKTTLPIIENILFKEELGKLVLSATDLETNIRVSTDLEAPEGLCVAVPSRTILDLLKAVSGDITLMFEENVLKVRSSSGAYKIATVPGGEFPSIDIESGENSVKAYLLEKAIEVTAGSVTNDDLRPVMTGVYFDLENGNLVSTDGHRMSIYNAPIEGTPFIVPPKNLRLLKGLSDQDVFYTVSENMVHFNTNEFSFSVRLVDGKYPPYQQVIPKNNDKSLIITQKDLLESVKRVSLFSNSETRQIKLKLGENIIISGQDLNYNSSADEKLDGIYYGEPIEIGLNSKYLIDMLNTTGEGGLTLTFSEPNKPVLIYNKTNPKLTQLVMPLSL